ncbi:CinA family nicotinamide mononucleotide deamidase-related protein [Thermodesulfobacteriota bacterium]
MNAVPDTPTCEIITIGSELLLGQITDTNTTFLARELGKIGISVRFRTAVGDRLDEVGRVVRKAAERCDIVITTGGLGPTLDDLTREAVSRAAGVELEFREDLMDQIEGIFRSAGFKMSENNRRQAFVPVGSQSIHNPVGTAPAFIVDVNGKPVICLPGVPRELDYLLQREVIPWLMKRFQLKGRIITYKVLRTAGIGESAVDRLIGDLMAPDRNPEVGLLASAGETRIRITAKADNEKEAMGLIGPVEEDIRLRLGEKIYGEGEDSLEGVIDLFLSKRSLTLSVLETFSGGLIAQRFNELPSSRLITSLVISGEKDVKQWLGQREMELEREAVRGLAYKIRDMGSTDLGLAMVGFPEKKEGRYVLKGYSYVTGEDIEKYFPWQTAGELPIIRQRGAVIGLNSLRLALLETID